MEVELFSWGAAQEVTGSKHFLQFEGQLFQIDCGAFQGRREESEKKNASWPFNASEVTSLVLTHAHFDHSGLIPLLPKNEFTGNIYSTPATRDLASLIMMDSAHIQARDIEFLKKRAQRKGKKFNKKPLYTEQDVIDALNQFITVSYQRPVRIGNNTLVDFYDAGHILGSAIPVVTMRANGNELSVCAAGDIGRKNLPILRDPQPIPDVDYLIMESTYGHRLHDPVETACDKLAEVVNNTINRGGKIIIPAFAIERTQELVYYLHLLNKENKIPKVPVYVDSPMATNATGIFRVHQECYDQETRDVFLQNHKNPFGFDELHYITGVAESKWLNEQTEPSIIISASGMCEAGRILHHLDHNIENSDNTILIVGFMAKHTLGRRIKEQQEEVRIFGETRRLNAEVVTLNTFSAHADYNELLEFVSQFDKNRLREIFLVHGEPDAQANLKTLLENNGYRATIVAYEQKYQLAV